MVFALRESPTFWKGHSMSASTRLDPPKIEFNCTCGKRYRVPADKAGKRVRCKNCRLKVRLKSANAAFLSDLNRSTLADCVYIPDAG